MAKDLVLHRNGVMPASCHSYEEPEINHYKPIISHFAVEREVSPW
jgi:hypothetical protein